MPDFSNWTETSDYNGKTTVGENKKGIQSGIIYIRRKSMKTKAEKQIDDLDSLLSQKATLEQKIKEVKEKEKNNIKVGDYIICLKKTFPDYVKGSVLKVEEVFASHYRTKKSNYKLASSSEIESYLRAEADKKGYKVGVKVQYKDYRIGEIIEIKFAEIRSKFPSSAYESSKNILYVVWNGQYGENTAEINDDLKIIKEEIISINGYSAEYYKDYIQFGCAKIGINMLRDLSHMMNDSGGYYGNGNRFIEGDVKIGKGVFNKEIVGKLLKIHAEKRLE